MTTWNPSDKHADVNLSESDLRADVGTSGSGKGVRATTFRDSANGGSYCYEVEIVAKGSFWVTMGFSTTSHTDMSVFCGNHSQSWGADPHNVVFRNNNTTTAISSTAQATSDVFTIGVNLDDNSMSLWRNGTFIDTKYSNLTGKLYPHLSIYTNADARGRFDEGDFTEGVPSGYEAWDYVAPTQRLVTVGGFGRPLEEQQLFGRLLGQDSKGLSVTQVKDLLATAADITYERLDTNGDVGTAAGQLAIGNHNHSALYQPLNSVLTKLTTAFVEASASGPATLDLAEDTDSGTNRIRLSAPAAVTSDVTISLPDTAGTVRLTNPTTKSVTASTSSTALDFANCDVITVTLEVATTELTASNAVFGQPYRIKLLQDATGGRAVTLGTGFNVGDDVAAPVVSGNTASEHAWVGVIGRADGGVDLVTNAVGGFS